MSKKTIFQCLLELKDLNLRCDRVIQTIEKQQANCTSDSLKQKQLWKILVNLKEKASFLEDFSYLFELANEIEGLETKKSELGHKIETLERQKAELKAEIEKAESYVR